MEVQNKTDFAGTQEPSRHPGFNGVDLFGSGVSCLQGERRKAARYRGAPTGGFQPQGPHSTRHVLPKVSPSCSGRGAGGVAYHQHTCVLCHMRFETESPAIQKLAKIHREGGDLEWIRVYRVPDFVFFSHASHVNSGIACERCHGLVQDRHILDKDVATNMESCMNCHATRKVSMECPFCHELGE